MTAQKYVSIEKIDNLREHAQKALELAAGQSKMILVDLQKVREYPKVSQKDNKPYMNYIVEVVELAAENEEIPREIEVTEFQLGKIAELIGSDATAGTLKVTGEKNGDFVRKKYEKI